MSLIKEIRTGSLVVKIYDTRVSMGDAAAFAAAQKIKELLEEKEAINIIFAAAPSQNEFLSALLKYKEIKWTKINAFHMDEYIGIDEDAPQRFGNFLKDRIFCKVQFKSVNYINGNAKNLEGECERYSQLLIDNPPDIIFMGIGENGHIAFNDPHVADFNDKKFVKVVELDKRCRMQQVNDGCFKSIEEVPLYAITLTIPALMSGKTIFCVVPSKTKAEAVYNTACGDVTEACPASILKTHPDATLYTDLYSGSRLIKL